MATFIFMLAVVVFFVVLVNVCLNNSVPDTIKKDVLNNSDKFIKHENSKQCDGYNFSKVAGGWCDITQCRDCKATDEYWSQHPANPCRYCGGALREIGSGIYIDKFWYSRKKI